MDSAASRLSATIRSRTTGSDPGCCRSCCGSLRSVGHRCATGGGGRRGLEMPPEGEDELLERAAFRLEQAVERRRGGVMPLAVGLVLVDGQPTAEVELGAQRRQKVLQRRVGGPGPQ